MNIKNKRLDFLDIAKAVTIFLVLMGHIGTPDTVFFYRRIIYSFHMPAFLVITGIVSKRKEEYTKQSWLCFLKKNAFELLIPYFFWGIIYSNFNYPNLLRIVYGSWKTISDAGSVLAFWYLVSLFLTRIELEALLQFSKKLKIDSHLFAALMSPIAFAIGIFLPKPAIGYPWEFDASFAGLGFMLLGYAIQDLLNNFTNKNLLSHLVLFAVSLSLFTAGIIYIGDELELILLFKVYIANPYLFFYLSLTGVAATISFGMLIARIYQDKVKPTWYKAVTWIGRNTLGILVLHKPFLPDVVAPFLISLGMDLSNVFTSIIGSLITIPYNAICILLITKYCPVLLGKHKKSTE